MSKQTTLSKDRVNKLIGLLSSEYKDAKYYLNFGTPIDLVVAAILSAQTRDEVTNSVTPAMFARYRTARDYAKASADELVGYISRVSFAGNKARSIISTMKIIEQKYGGKVPKRMEELIELPGVGRKTANTILVNAYGIVEGIPVDTWVIKLSYRLGLSINKDPEKIEQDLMAAVDRKYWHNLAYILKTHGKRLCQTVPICSKCPARALCPRDGVTKQL